MKWQDLMKLVAIGQDEVGSQAQQLGKDITVDRGALIMWAHKAIFQTDSEACMRARVADLIEDMVSRDPQATAYSYECKPAKSWQVGTHKEKEESAMENSKPSPAATKSLPWYDNRVEAVRKGASAPPPCSSAHPAAARRTSGAA